MSHKWCTSSAMLWSLRWLKGSLNFARQSMICSNMEQSQIPALEHALQASLLDPRESGFKIIQSGGKDAWDMDRGTWNVGRGTRGKWDRVKRGRKQLPNESKNEMARSRLAYSEFPARPAATRDRWPSVPARSRMRLEPTFARLGTKRAFFSCCLCKVPRRDYTSNIRCLQILAARKPYENALWPKSTERRQ